MGERCINGIKPPMHAVSPAKPIAQTQIEVKQKRAKGGCRKRKARHIGWRKAFKGEQL